MRTRTRNGAIALVAATAVAATVAPRAWTADDVRTHETKHEYWAAGLADDPDVPAEPLPGADCVDGRAGIFPCDGIDLLSFTPAAAFGDTTAVIGSSGVSDVWGWTSEDGREYAMVGKTTGVAFMDVTDPRDPVLLGNLDSPVAADLIWFDIKVVGDHAVIVSESAAHGLFTFDLTQLVGLEEDPQRSFSPTGIYPLTGSAHNVAVNVDQEMAYVVGGNNGLAVEDHCRASLHAVDVSDPAQPMFAGCYLEEGGFGVVGSLAGVAGETGTTVARQLSRYVHDAHCFRYDDELVVDEEHAGKDLCITSAEDHVSVVDMSDPLFPVLLGTAEYEGARYAHQGWLSTDGRHFFLGDELDETGGVDQVMVDGQVRTRTLVFDVTDLDAPTFAFDHFGETASIDHNMYTLEDGLFQSNYTAGLVVLDTKRVDRGRLTEVARFDVTPSLDDTSFSGTWSNYPYFDSGTIVISGYEGVWLVDLQPRVEARIGLRGGPPDTAAARLAALVPGCETDDDGRLRCD